MKTLNKLVDLITSVLKWIAVFTIIFMMLAITYSVIGRAVGYPVIGNVEITELSMVVIVMFGLAYTQSEKAHISITLIVDRFSYRIRSYLEIFGLLLTFIVTIPFAWVFIIEGLNTTITSTLIKIPHSPFKYVIAIGFALWGIKSFSQAIILMFNLRGEKQQINN